MSLSVTGRPGSRVRTAGTRSRPDPAPWPGRAAGSDQPPPGPPRRVVVIVTGGRMMPPLPPPGPPGFGLGGGLSVGCTGGGGVGEGTAPSGMSLPMSAFGGNFVFLSALSAMALVAFSMKLRQIVLGMPLPQIVLPLVSLIGFPSVWLPTQTAAAIFLVYPIIHAWAFVLIELFASQLPVLPAVSNPELLRLGIFDEATPDSAYDRSALAPGVRIDFWFGAGSVSPKTTWSPSNTLNTQCSWARTPPLANVATPLAWSATVIGYWPMPRTVSKVAGVCSLLSVVGVKSIRPWSLHMCSMPALRAMSST